MFVSSLGSTNLDVELSSEASWNVFNGLLPGCLETLRMSSPGVFLSLSISDDKGDFSFTGKQQDMDRYSCITTGLTYRVQKRGLKVVN